ncbi:unnamed protein product [Amaranthus hypochondriacus]
MKTQNYECCMCGDHGLSNQLFRCKVCHFRSQHRYCSNLYPKAETYRVCNWCLIQNDDRPTLTTTSNYTNNSSNSPSATTKKSNSVGIIKLGLKPKSLQPTSPIKKPNRSPETGSPLGRKRINSPIENQDKLRKTKSEELSNNNNNNNNSGSSSRNSSGGSGGGGPSVIKHVFRNKVRRYKLLDEVSS